MIQLPLCGQNLIPDGGFEEIPCPDNSINSISNVEPWASVGADAYLLRVDCPYDPVASAAVVALRDYVPYRGFANISLEAALTLSGFFISEGMSTQLLKPLENGNHYYFDMAYMNYEGVLSRDYETGDCDPLPDRALHVLLGNESLVFDIETIQSIEGFAITDMSINGVKTLSINEPFEENFDFNKWYTYWDCFEAQGGESNLAVVGEYGKNEPPIDCFELEAPGMVYASGYGIDELRLVEIPQTIDSTYTTCIDKSVNIDLRKIVNGPYADKATYLWDDGSVNPEKQLIDARVYEAQMILPCVTVPINITINEVKCTADIYVPNVFRPNVSGQNNALLPQVVSELQLSSYAFSVYDRWGEVVFNTRDLQTPWNGNFKGKRAEQGVYTWKIEYTLENSDQLIREFGEVLRL